MLYKATIDHANIRSLRQSGKDSDLTIIHFANTAQILTPPPTE